MSINVNDGKPNAARSTMSSSVVLCTRRPRTAVLVPTHLSAYWSLKCRTSRSAARSEYRDTMGCLRYRRNALNNSLSPNTCSRVKMPSSPARMSGWWVFWGLGAGSKLICVSIKRRRFCKWGCTREGVVVGTEEVERGNNRCMGERRNTVYSLALQRQTHIYSSTNTAVLYRALNPHTHHTMVQTIILSLPLKLRRSPHTR